MSHISTYSIQELRDYFEREVSRPAWRPWLREMDNLDAGIKAGPVSIGKFRELFRGLTSAGRFRYGAWRWIHPTPPYLDLADVASLQRAAGLDHLERSLFVHRLEDVLKEMIRDHPQLTLWIQRRLALLNHSGSPSKLSQDLEDLAFRLRFSLAQAISAAPINPGEAANLADDICFDALGAAAEAARQVLGKGGCRFSANLMVPAPIKDRGGPGFTPTTAAENNARIAADLWEDLSRSSESCLVIVAETMGADHLGFWIPLRRGDGGKALPGAPTAYFGLEGSAVFAEDLPPLEGFTKTLERQWHAYMGRQFREALFVSLPLVVPADEGGRKTIAVLNVNADPPPDDGWRRAYHKEWLAEATARVGAFIEIALYAINVGMAINSPEQYSEIDYDSQLWTMPEGDNT